MAKFNRSKIQVYQYDHLSTSDFESISLDDMIAKLQKLRDRHGGEGRFNLEIEYYDNTDVKIEVSSYREETDEELLHRVTVHKALEKHKRDDAKARKAFREEHDRKEFERLSKKFGK